MMIKSVILKIQKRTPGHASVSRRPLKSNAHLHLALLVALLTFASLASEATPEGVDPNSDGQTIPGMRAVLNEMTLPAGGSKSQMPGEGAARYDAKA